ncbi:acyl-CoA dehydrogenase family protein [Thalassobacillus sp. CUG 92003]|uniref:acyl-CoA dehydrogenase family protein n=1 Tax=Thalassobacillus sp. CUG 92003 TaxID=2736641 RepID=UPI0015E6802E|nr:acyl-CoA dehydrogenase family protein [Thalassobacillus sp. CUG 92003]
MVYHPYVTTTKQQEMLERINPLVERFHERAGEIDEQGRFPFENVEELKSAGYLSLTVPKKYGGEGIDLYDYVLLQERLAEGDGSTALSVGWHLGSVLEIEESNTWHPATFGTVCDKVVQEKALLNRAATEKGTGSPTRGGMPATQAIHNGNGWEISGRKSFTSMAVALDYSLVTAQIEDTDRIGVFLINHRLQGVHVEDTWNMIAMRGTRSDDLVLDHVHVPEDALVEEENQASGPSLPKAWLLHIPACYLGIARAARNYAIHFAETYQPNSLPGPIKEVPEVQRKIGEMELSLFQAREMLYSVAARWVNHPEKRYEMATELGAVKHTATNHAASVVDMAMRIVGARSLAQDNPLQRYYRDVRSGLHNPPMDDAVINALAKQALTEEEKNDSRTARSS